LRLELNPDFNQGLYGSKDLGNRAKVSQRKMMKRSARFVYWIGKIKGV
jgi:hypothetical protein